MKQCPVCHQAFTRSMLAKKALSKPVVKRLGENLTDGKYVTRCPHCNARLRKKFSVWFIPALIPYIVSVVLYYYNRSLAFLMYLSIAFFVIFYANLPYVPYDKD